MHKYFHSKYRDDLEHRWKRKLEGNDKEYFWDKNNKIYRHIISSETRNGLTETDYEWNPHLGRWLPRPESANKTRVVNRPGDDKNLDPLRNYNKPWMKAAPLRYPEKKKKKKGKGKKEKDIEEAEDDD